MIMIRLWRGRRDWFIGSSRGVLRGACAVGAGVVQCDGLACALRRRGVALQWASLRLRARGLYFCLATKVPKRHLGVPPKTPLDALPLLARSVPDVQCSAYHRAFSARNFKDLSVGRLSLRQLLLNH